jgi:uncharacterized protein (TIGR02611 family)
VAAEGKEREQNVPEFVKKLRDQREKHLERSRAVRIVMIVAGFTIFLGGVVMLVTPGPAFVLIPIGLAMLSMEFVWAERLLDKSLEQAAKAQQKAAETTRKQRALVAIATVLAIAAAGLAVLWWDIPLLPDN